MTHKDAGKYSKKHAHDEKPDTVLASAIKGAAEEGKISCAGVFKIVSELGVSPAEAGKAVDMLDVKLVKCQLGLFGYEPRKVIVTPAAKVSPELDSAIRGNLQDGRLPCAHAWRIADMLKLQRMEVSCAAEALNIRIKPCQLGAF